MPECACHGVPMVWHKDLRRRLGGWWLCSVRRREENFRSNSRRVRMGAGGIRFHLGMAPTAEDAERIRDKIKKEAP